MVVGKRVTGTAMMIGAFLVPSVRNLPNGTFLTSTLGRGEPRTRLKTPQFPLMLGAMTGTFRIREIAAQAGLSEATVDRVLHRRSGVRASTVEEVHQAIADLERQRSQLRIAGRTFMADVVVQAPARFSVAVRTALEAELPGLRPAVIRSRFHLHEGASVTALVADLARITRTGSHGVILKAPDVPEVLDAVARLTAAGIPVVTLVTDLPTSARAAYVGIDNRAAGATAAYLLGQWLGGQPGDILVVRGSSSFRGEDEREMGFRGTLRAAVPRRAQVDVVDDEDLASALAGERPVRAGGPPIGPRRVLHVRGRRRQHGGAGRVRRARPALRRVSSRTTWTARTPRCCSSGGSPWCCTTTCGTTCAAPAR